MIKHTQGDSAMQKWRCVPCDYVYDPAQGDPENGIAPGTGFEDLSEVFGPRRIPSCGGSSRPGSKPSRRKIFKASCRNSIMCGTCFGREALIGICCCPAASCRRQPAVWSIRIEKSRLKMPLTRSARFPVGCASITELAPDAETISHEYFSVEEMGLRNKRPVDDILSPPGALIS